MRLQAGCTRELFRPPEDDSSAADPHAQGDSILPSESICAMNLRALTVCELFADKLHTRALSRV